MLEWVKITFILCAFGTLREIRPSEPFVTDFLSGEWRNITSEQLFRDVYPVSTYSYMALLIVIFLITDFLRFKPVIILSGLTGISIYAILLWTTSIEWLYVSQFFFGLYMATEVAYYTYMYAKVESSKYARVTSLARVAALSGRFLSGVSSQLLTHLGVMDFRQLNYITFSSQILATLWAFWLPSVDFGIYFHRRGSLKSNYQENLYPPNETFPPPKPKQSFTANLSTASRLITRHACAAYARPRVLAWSALYAAALALFTHAQYYVQLLWQQIQRDDEQKVQYNGAVEAVQTLAGAGGALLAACGARPALPPAPAAAAAAAALQAAASLLSAYLPDIYLAYACYIALGTLFHFTVTMASAKIACELSDDSCFGLIFGINMFSGAVLQSLLTLVLNQALALEADALYAALGALYALLAAACLLAWAAHNLRQKRAAAAAAAATDTHH